MFWQPSCHAVSHTLPTSQLRPPVAICKLAQKFSPTMSSGQMATAFNSMLDRITTLVSTEEERDTMQKRLMQFLVLVSEVGKGDLTKRGEVTADMFGNLADAFNLMIARFGQLLKQVREAAERVNKSAGTLRDSAGQMSGTARTSGGRIGPHPGRRRTMAALYASSG